MCQSRYACVLSWPRPKTYRSIHKQQNRSSTPQHARLELLLGLLCLVGVLVLLVASLGLVCFALLGFSVRGEQSPPRSERGSSHRADTTHATRTKGKQSRAPRGRETGAHGGPAEQQRCSAQHFLCLPWLTCGYSTVDSRWPPANPHNRTSRTGSTSLSSARRGRDGSCVRRIFGSIRSKVSESAWPHDCGAVSQAAVRPAGRSCFLCGLWATFALHAAWSGVLRCCCCKRRAWVHMYQLVDAVQSVCVVCSCHGQ